MNQVKRKKRKAHVEERDCVACGCCVKVCPMSAIQIFHGVMAVVDQEKCVVLGFFQILFAWLGLLCFFIPLIIAIVKGNKGYCNRYCGRGQLFELIGGRFGLSRRKDVPKWMKSKAFRYGFLIFFFAMFFQMLWTTYLVFSGVESLHQAVTLLWTWKLPWNWAYHGVNVSPGIAQFAFGFYSVMLTSTLLGFVTMLLFKPRSWCVYCPMGTMTQLICKGKNKRALSDFKN